MQKQNGFTLIEIMISVGVFAILILGLGYAVLAGQRVAGETRSQAIVLLACQQVVEQLQGKSIEELLAEDNSTFSIRMGGADASMEPGGVINVDKDLNGDGTIQTGDFYREGRTEDDIVRVRISFKGTTIIEKVFARRSN
jgi:prepilin-type N-terminal cleavage/methylation domain-containing protein